MIKVAEVVEIECQDEMENMDVVDAVWEERLEMMCKELIQELVQKSVEEAGRMLCKDLLETTLVDRCWGRLEYGQIMKDILGGESNLKVEIETGEMDIREVEEAEVAMLMEEAAVIRRQEKVERLRMAWRKRMRLQEYEMMVKGLSKLSVTELEGDMEEIEMLVQNLMIGDTGGCTGKYNFINMVDMDTAESNSSDRVIRWADEQMDTRTMEEGSMEDNDMAGAIMEIEHPVDEEGKMNTELTL